MVGTGWESQIPATPCKQTELRVPQVFPEATLKPVSNLRVPEPLPRN